MASDTKRPEELAASQDLLLPRLHLGSLLSFENIPNETGAELQKGKTAGEGKVQTERVREEASEP